jgi:hypothetical protein
MEGGGLSGEEKMEELLLKRTIAPGIFPFRGPILFGVLLK